MTKTHLGRRDPKYRTVPGGPVTETRNSWSAFANEYEGFAVAKLRRELACIHFHSGFSLATRNRVKCEPRALRYFLRAPISSHLTPPYATEHMPGVPRSF